ncbi:hypothetical protein AMTRI_Chr07g24210 [Amborella trichopoda]|uniref:RRM domain-containing protein n=1 Tax=Amborella trichopoda TaxID=13333 RepID=U5DBH2_AMBTC|nr:RNA-binding protein 42 [Amborella trichopoda]ERN18782.1 hypothetical protein AMTR_s00067p00070310 [Amborella trichopoda]|eukprot:XP_006857315.1 RNA-binding protein 42 [Amborella trichopoda]
MANLLSELERFEQEMKELDDTQPSSSSPRTVTEPGTHSSRDGITRSEPSSTPIISPPKPPSTIAQSASVASVTPQSQWNNNGIRPNSSVGLPLPPPNTSSSSQFTFSNASYGSGPAIPTPPIASVPTPPAPFFPLPFHLQKPGDQLVQQLPEQQYLIQEQQQTEQQYHVQPQYAVPQFQPPIQKQYPLTQLPQPPKVQVPQVTYPQMYPAPALYPAPAPVAGLYSLPQYQQAQQLFQRDAQTITPEALESVKAALASSENEHKAETKKKALPRKAAGQTWEDPTLAEWPENDYRLFCGDLGNEVNDEVLSKAFSRFAGFNMARVVRDKRTGKTRGYGFVSFASPSDLALALKEMNGKYVGNRPIKLRKSNWKDRTDYEALERQKNHTQKKPKLPKKGILHK